jgi:hypothetical protein
VTRRDGIEATGLLWLILAAILWAADASAYLWAPATALGAVDVAYAAWLGVRGRR